MTVDNMHHGTSYDGEAWKSLDFTLAEHAKAHGEERCLIRCNRDLQDDPVPMLKFFPPVVNGEIIDHLLGSGCGGQRSGISRQLFDWGGWRWIQPPFVRRQKVEDKRHQLDPRRSGDQPMANYPSFMRVV
jgi:hypothetical protein